jgi:hypothetical protein
MRTTLLVIFFFLGLGAFLRGPTLLDSLAACTLLAVILLVLYAIVRGLQKLWRAAATAAAGMTDRS